MAEEIAFEGRNLTVRFGSFAALSDVSISVAERTIHSVIGPNGAGKTTLFNVLCGVTRATSGEISIGGVSVTHKPLHARVARGLARSFQITNVFKELSVRENLRLAAQALNWDQSYCFWRGALSLERPRSKAEQLLDELSLRRYADMKAGDLSHGNQRALEVGMALASDPKVLLLDEPLAGMGVEDISRMKGLIADQGRLRTVLLIEHNMGVVLDISHRITVLQQGRLLAEGSPSEVQLHPAVRTAYLGEP